MAVALFVEMLFFSCLFLLPISVISQNNGRVAVGSSLTATTGDSSSWLSPSGDFAFGFSPLGNNDHFLLSIWYAKIPVKTVVWYAYAYDGNNPMVAPRGSVLNLTDNSGLVLNNPQGEEIWKSKITSGIVANGVMNDTGNFVLQDENSGSLWGTFNHPTDTVLPGQTIERNGTLSCRQSETNYTKGRFQLLLQGDGNLMLRTVNLTTGNANPPYFHTDTTAGKVPGSEGKQLVFSSSGDMFVLRENDGRVPLTRTEGVSVRDNYIRATLDFDGIFALYSHPKNFTGNASWISPLVYMPDDICLKLGVGVCGYNSICTLKPDKRPNCECSKGFSFLDPKDIYRGCKPDLSRKSVTRVESVLLADKWFWIGISIAAALVLCTAYYLLRRRRSALASAGENRTEIESEMLNFMKSNRPTDDVNGLRNDGKIGHHDLSIFSYSTIVAATSNFAEENKLGEGGFGPVFKGKLAMGQEIAVKRLSKCSGQGTSEFKNELILIYELQHTNLVQLFGFCIHGEEMMLIYEYLQNKSLDHFLFDPTRGRLLDWKKRFSILEGIAQGLLYLHKYSRKKVIHRDLKASNILLDENMNPKISDFGLARIFTQNELEANTSKIVGTRGYMPPESMEGIISVKSDVYSFGVLILEIISGRKNNSFYNDDRALNLVGYAWELWKEGAGLELRDPTLGNSFIKEQLLRCIHVGLLCVEENAADRPTMSDVISMLTTESLPLASPTKPAFFVGRRTVEAGISGNQQLEIASANHMSISDFEAR
ncbi:cysteine-rich receptor-like protein kinase 34 isoform X1 [Pyrus x bretschneideri]|uniref:cysteine-rich receptor-like protein kinase 34 isoform X1 n=1 Tax=Pyrus x bretschneideri TaxID=225117 RepID=UPI002030E45E|nr:cysteine-rich receptor-like protein kinase 34 isoform X1 [Pyrus x bretschneideri]